MFPVGLSILLSLFFLNTKFYDFEKPIYTKVFITTLLILKIDFLLFFLSNSTEYPFLLNSLFIVILIFIALRIFSEYLNMPDLYIISKAIFSASFINIITSLIFSIISINHFWPILDNDLKFSLFSHLFPNSERMFFFASIYIISELLSLIIFSNYLMFKLISNKSSGIQIRKLSSLIKAKKYLFIIFLGIFFVVYTMNISQMNNYLTVLSASYLFVLSYSILTILKTDLNI